MDFVLPMGFAVAMSSGPAPASFAFASSSPSISDSRASLRNSKFSSIQSHSGLMDCKYASTASCCLFLSSHVSCLSATKLVVSAMSTSMDAIFAFIAAKESKLSFSVSW
jgi:hypothetical protein